MKRKQQQQQTISLTAKWHRTTDNHHVYTYTWDGVKYWSFYLPLFVTLPTGKVVTTLNPPKQLEIQISLKKEKTEC